MLTREPFIIYTRKLSSGGPHFSQNEVDVMLKKRVAEDALEAFDGISIEQCDRSLGGVLGVNCL